MYRRRPSQYSNIINVNERTTFHVIKDKTINFKFNPLHILLLTIIIFTLFFTPTVFRRLSHILPSWTDQRYTSTGDDLSWDEISEAISKISNLTEIQSIGLLNFNKHEIHTWENLIIPEAKHIVPLHLDYIDKSLTWELLYPEWIDEEQEEKVPVCPSFPKIKVPERRLDIIVVKLPCRDDVKWARDVARLHLQRAAAGLAVNAKGYYSVHLLFASGSRCFPLPNLFPCKEIVFRGRKTWLYKPNLNVMREKLQFPVGSCELSLPLLPKDHAYSGNVSREAYVTILHSTDTYVCGAIAVAQSIRMSGSNRDLLILVDETINGYHRSGLHAAGWKIKTFDRIRNPKAEKDAYNEWNYSKFRLWQLTDYDKIIFIDADMLVLRNLDPLFNLHEVSATGNDGSLFNSGVMVIEPSECMFDLLMDHVEEIESYNGGDQGYLNEVFTWWHRIPRNMNFLKHIWEGDGDEEKEMKKNLFGLDPPVLFVIHYLGIKPWLCFRDYDCNWNVDILQEFASDEAHWKWWKVHDGMSELLQQFCLLRTTQKAQLLWDRLQAEKANFSDGHWGFKIRDGRLKKCTDNYCSWKNVLKNWNNTNHSNEHTLL
ncbi:UDP-glucuronate:xylan alpha-glucuronosyltransferase 1-like [Impatiens glandulifera]|uniref:UDP-glucuronate:xylan alpha-glucuronosyltransferase 1-like n=1 Tax=Impatiens glandulifera TaxID=253017 RepID=UPI001FB0B669|nr:UDP-glucuronate:xylan alpha-glucuronosyltransferase 1-like [Impatiens glandulifera]